MTRCTALHVAAESNQIGAIDALVEAGADLELGDDDGCTPLAVRCVCNKWEAMRGLRRHGAKVNGRHNKARTPLHPVRYGKCEGFEAAVDLLLRWGADEKALEKNGETPEDLFVERITKKAPTRNYEGRATGDKISLTRLLLSRAHADTTWCRRGWLVMLRLLPHEWRIPMRCESCKVTREKGTRCDGGDLIVGRVVGLLVGLEPKGAFRTGLSFL